MHISPDEWNYYQRQIGLNNFGEEAQLALKKAKVLVVGAGGLGCPLLQYLGAAGVGSLFIADADVIAPHNLNRQILFTLEDVGKNKAQIAAQKIKKLNPYIETEVFTEWIDSKNVQELFSKVDLICDCSDNFETRYLLNDASCLYGKPLVSAAVVGYEGQLSVFNHKTKINYRDVFPEPDENALNCSLAGVIGALCGIIGSMQANEAIKIITQIGETIEGKLLYYNALKNETRYFTIQHISNVLELQKEYNYSCSSSTTTHKEIELDELNALKEKFPNMLILDIREIWEHEERNIGGINIPLAKLSDNLENFDKNTPILLYCNAGQRSAVATHLLNNKGFIQVFHLRLGADF